MYIYLIFLQLLSFTWYYLTLHKNILVINKFDMNNLNVSLNRSSLIYTFFIANFFNLLFEPIFNMTQLVSLYTVLITNRYNTSLHENIL